ncbi:DUF1801 domain-containing protein [Halobaculum lipolyticum]|uniref:DUF1801 domain-containing protein n=1 Tax=Halobaculum lipolyticum TaxID=3032001 RepID=A0ABD5WDK2_9EURY|nr:DUF1801 domain-containing protein [Halobaculum sp. DT31]
MNAAEPLTAERISDLVVANRVIRAPYYHAAHDDGVEFTEPDKGLQWGADVVPALQGLFRVDRDTREDRPDGWVGFARHWRGNTMRVDVDLFSASEESDPVLVVTAIAGRAGDGSVRDDDLGPIEVPDRVPTREEWEERRKRYQAARRRDDADGSASVEAYLAALPGWKREVATRFDELVRREVPEVHSAVRYHQPFYGIQGTGWFAAFSPLSKHVKLTFVAGSELDPVPPDGTGPQRQALDLTETDTLEETQVASWVRQAAADPGMNW